jgi:hypothetical protein
MGSRARYSILRFDRTKEASDRRSRFDVNPSQQSGNTQWIETTSYASGPTVARYRSNILSLESL